MLIDFLVFNATFSNISAISWFHQSLVAIGPVVSEEKIKM
jgi:hypothetical protein